jgi:hypothetical protein
MTDQIQQHSTIILLSQFLIFMNDKIYLTYDIKV